MEPETMEPAAFRAHCQVERRLSGAAEADARGTQYVPGCRMAACYKSDRQLRVTLSVTLTEEGDDQTLEVTVRCYQACRATDCFLPSAVRVELPLKAADHVERPRRQ